MPQKENLFPIDPFIQKNDRASHLLTPCKIVLLAIVSETASLISEDRPAINEKAERDYLILLCKLTEVYILIICLVMYYYQYSFFLNNF